jgi:lipid II:glycine glycyltransferase (peptidoglycan interpeptide bridge formation enzyme)
MITRVLYEQEKTDYNSVVTHPVQTWEWGEFQESQGHKVYRFGVFDNKKIVSGFSLSFHRVPRFNRSIGTILRGPYPTEEIMTIVRKIAKEENAIFVKMEPDVFFQTYDTADNPSVPLSPLPDYPDLKISPKVAFYPYTYVIDLTKSEDQLLSLLHPKTRYNIKLANRHGVKVEEVSTDQGFETYLKILFDTTRRQGFYLHSPQYHREQWKVLKDTGIPHIFLASYNDKALAAFMIFTLKDKLFYPYGASLDANREVMAPNLLMWEVIKYGQSKGLKTFDMWGSLGTKADPSDPAYGFHRFKQSYGGTLTQFIGTYDLILDPSFYKYYNLADKFRWKYLRATASLRSFLSPFLNNK